MTDPTKCPRCGREVNPYACSWPVARCNGPEDQACATVRAAYLRGLRAGVEMAKDHDRGVPMEWSDVDAELARMEEG